ncbi:MAG: ABC transporter permease [Deltaproteobacteria bacterium]|nr:ABC transporter permease [Deltaproteobacteria bacterium]MBW2678651.1 ABC transporter permease [Deltaproteobacteria bacterium]
MKKKKRIAQKILWVLSILTLIFLWAPMILIMVYSFSNSKYGSSWEGFTLKWYAKLFTNDQVRDALMRSLIIAGVTVVIATLIGTMTAYGLFKLNFKGKQFLRTSILLPIVFPSVVTGGALLVFFTRLVHIPLGYPSIIIAHIVFCSPLAVFIILGRMQRFDWSWEEAALDLGATPFRTFLRVTGPQLLPAIMASAMLIFPWSFDDFVITYFVSGVGSTTLPIYVFSQLRFGATPVINTIGTLFVSITMLGMVLVYFVQKMGKSST